MTLLSRCAAGTCTNCKFTVVAVKHDVLGAISHGHDGLEEVRMSLRLCIISSTGMQVAFMLDDDPDQAQMVAWTTTPWTLPSNLSLCVHPEMTYVRVRCPQLTSAFVTLASMMLGHKGAQLSQTDRESFCMIVSVLALSLR